MAVLVQYAAQALQLVVVLLDILAVAQKRNLVVDRERHVVVIHVRFRQLFLYINLLTLF